MRKARKFVDGIKRILCLMLNIWSGDDDEDGGVCVGRFYNPGMNELKYQATRSPRTVRHIKIIIFFCKFIHVDFYDEKNMEIKFHVYLRDFRANLILSVPLLYTFNCLWNI